jgi:hypothetical protein
MESLFGFLSALEFGVLGCGKPNVKFGDHPREVLHDGRASRLMTADEDRCRIAEESRFTRGLHG